MNIFLKRLRYFLRNRLLFCAQFQTPKKRKKKSTPDGVVSFLNLPLTVAQFLTVKDQLIHIRHAVVNHFYAPPFFFSVCIIYRLVVIFNEKYVTFL